MTALGKILLSSPGGENAASPSSAIACKLTKPFSQDFSWTCADSVWAVAAEARGGHIVACARSRLTFDETRHKGAAAIMQALDMAAVEENQVSAVQELGDYSIVRFYDGDKPTLRLSSVLRQAISMRVEIEQRDAAGNLIPLPATPPPSWHRTFRYYRLSQLSYDVYEAYRNLYLAFEALAEHISPRTLKEREGDWIRRAFDEAHQKYGLGGLVPEKCTNPGDYLFGTLYKHVRCNLFHSQSADSILPYYQVDASKVQHAYETLLRTWRHVAGCALGTVSGGAVITHQGFRHMMSNAFAGDLMGIVTKDEIPTDGPNLATSPVSIDAEALDECTYLGETSPGTVTIAAEHRDARGLPKIRRAGIKTPAVAQLLCEVPEGLDVGEVGLFQMHFGIRLVQGSMPKTEF